MSSFYDNLLSATDNMKDITFKKYGTITRVDNNLCNVREAENELEHTDVPIMNGVTLELGDKVIIGFINNSIYNPIILGTLSRKVYDSYTKDEIDELVDEIISGDIDLDRYMTKEEYVDDLNNHDETGEFLKGLDNVIIAITGRGEDYGNSQ